MRHVKSRKVSPICKHEFSVAVVATMSSGKSTLLNAMLGCALLPAKNEACTAKVFKLLDVDGLEKFRCRAKSSDGNWIDWCDVEADTLDEWNQGEFAEVEIHGDFPHIDNLLERISISFYDTPGPNNSRDRSHADIAKDILSSSDYSFVVCVLNATQFGVEDERALLVAINEQLIKRKGRNKVVFAVNKMDSLDIERGEEPLEIIRNVKKYLRTLGFYRPAVIPTIGSLSLDVREIFTCAQSGKEISMSSRRQKHFLNEFMMIRDFGVNYSNAILHTPRYKRFWDEAVSQPRSYSNISSVPIGGQLIAISELIKFDILTGIPILEEFLEIELKRFAQYINKRKGRSHGQS